MTTEQIASLWVEGIERDFTRLDLLSAPTMEVWHSTDDVWMDREQARRGAIQAEEKGHPVFRDIKTTLTSKGFVVQAAIDNPEDPTRVTFIVQVVSLEGDQVTRVEEYVAPGRRPVSPSAG